MIDNKLLVCAVASVVLHYTLARALEQLPARVARKPPPKVEVQVVAPPPPPPAEEPKPPEPRPEPPKPVSQAPRPVPASARIRAEVPKEAPPPDRPAPVGETTDEPVFGVTMESTSSASTGPAVPVGNTQKPTAPTKAGAPAPPLAEPVAAFEATKLPLPRSRCAGTYTDAAKAAGVEGTVVLDLVVGEDGRVRDVRVAEGLSHGLSEAAVAALRGCTFSPGERDGKPVAVRIRGFKIHFVLQEAR